ncbi:hypothetical protein V2E29_21405 [Streptomyces diastatochromogenes]|uniref:hypothetical protein n=1 Tax=Streptomyces diastatochromogenes TaxID=42236 RepID=UPI002F264876
MAVVTSEGRSSTGKGAWRINPPEEQKETTMETMPKVMASHLATEMESVEWTDIPANGKPLVKELVEYLVDPQPGTPFEGKKGPTNNMTTHKTPGRESWNGKILVDHAVEDSTQTTDHD